MARRNDYSLWDEHLKRTYGDKALFTFREACDILGCSMPSLYAMTYNKTLDVRRIESSPRITRLSLLRYLSDRPAPPPAQPLPAPKMPEQGRLF